MNDTGQFNEKRLPGHDYSRPGTYHLVFEVGAHASTFGSMKKGVMTLNAYGEIFLSVLGLALQIFSCLRLDAMDIRPTSIELVVSILKWRKPLMKCFASKDERWHYRRTMTISSFAGYLKMNSGRGINRRRKRSGTHFWALGFKDRVLKDKAEINDTIARLRAGFTLVRCSRNPAADGKRARTLCSAVISALGNSVDAAFGALYSGGPTVAATLEAPGLPFDTMLLGRALFLNSSLLRPESAHAALSGDGRNEVTGAHGGRTPEPLIIGIGPGRIVFPVPTDC
ncbi:MAG: hypothetical protein M5R41_19680 [Bacteroidia bacterium]|nr:hypothetical protein [Bacteroidia bacterium]